ncbi:MAG: glycosyltransferase [Chryseolinea sp.]
MKVLMLTPWYPDDANPNAGIFIRDQARALSKENEVVVIAAKVNYSKLSFFSYTIRNSITSGVDEYNISICKSLPLYNQINHLFITCWQSWLIGRRFKPDIIHASIGYPGAIWGWVLGKLLKKPFVFTEHTRVTNNFRSAVHKQLTLFGIRRARVAIAVGSTLANEIGTLTRREAIVVPNIVDVEKFNRAKRSEELVPQVGFLGGLNTPVKGLDVLLKAMAGINQPFVLHVGGRGILLEEYKSMAVTLGIEAKCQFYGFIDPAALPEFMSQLHFFVCSSRYETFCVSLIEAMASGLPVVSTRCGGPEDFVTEANGLLCEKEDPEALKSVIEDMMVIFRNYSPDEMKRHALQFAPCNVVKLLMNVYEQALHSK